MLKHEESLQTLPAAKVRVTPEELAAALSRIEARKEAGQRQADGTIPIGEAIQQLGIETTPEEVLAEVQAGRASKPKRRVGLRDRLGVAALVVLSLWAEAVYSFFGPAVGVDKSARRPDLGRHIHLAPPQAVPKRISLDPNLLVNTASHKLVMLSEIGDGQPVKCFFSDMPPPQFLPFTLDNNPAGAWTLIKHEGKVYIRGWIPRISTKALTTVGTDISGDVSYTRSQSPVPITLALDGFRTPSGTGDENVFHAVNIQLDKHAYEKWQP